MKKLMLLLIVLLVSFVGAIECQDRQEYWNVPCDIITPVMDCPDYVDTTIIIDTADTNINYTTNLTPVGDGTFNFSFFYANLTIYSITTCDNSSATVNVVFGIEEDETNFNLWADLFIIFFVLIIAGIWKQSSFFLFVGGWLIGLMGIWIFNEGITVYTVDYWFVYPLAWVFVGLSIILIVGSGINMIKEVE